MNRGSATRDILNKLVGPTKEREERVDNKDIIKKIAYHDTISKELIVDEFIKFIINKETEINMIITYDQGIGELIADKVAYFSDPHHGITQALDFIFNFFDKLFSIIKRGKIYGGRIHLSWGVLRMCDAADKRHATMLKSLLPIKHNKMIFDESMRRNLKNIHILRINYNNIDIATRMFPCGNRETSPFIYKRTIAQNKRKFDNEEEDDNVIIKNKKAHL